jgi:putative peptidoglycan lipid II flippase
VSTGTLARAAAIVLFFGMLSRLLGFAREVVLAAAFGTSATTDSYVNALLIVNSVAAVLLYTLVTLIIPTFQQERARDGIGSAWRLVMAIAAWSGLILVVLTALAAIWPEAAAWLFQLDPAREHETAKLIRIMAPALALQGFSAVFTAMLQIHGRFAGPAAVGVAFNLGIIGGVLVGANWIGIEAAGWGVTLGALFQVLLQLPEFRREMRGARARPALTHPRLASIGLLAVPVVLASTLQQVNNFTDKLFASSLDAGRVSALQFANALGQAPRVALLLPLLTPLFPLIARLISEDNDAGALRAFRRAAGLLGLVSIPMTCLLAVYSHEISQLAFERNKCGTQCIDQIQPPLFWYSFALWPAFAGMLLNRTLSAANRQRDIFWTTAVAVVVTIALDVVLLGPMDQAGLALASTIAVFLNAVLLVERFRRLFPQQSLVELGRRQLRVLASGLVAGAVALLLNVVLPTEHMGSVEMVAPLVLKILVATAAFLAAARVVAPAELADGIGQLRSLLPRRARRAQV